MREYLFDKRGYCSIRVVKGNLYDIQGFFLGYFIEERVINRKGTQVGWFRGGILRDLKGSVVAFSPEIRAGGPVPDLPDLESRPRFRRKRVRPRRVKPKKTEELLGFSADWSKKTHLSLFK